jgi:hypothetical protein
MAEAMTKAITPPSEKRHGAHPGWWTALAVFATGWAGVPYALPLAAAAPWVVLRSRGRSIATTASLRWLLAVVATGVAVVGMVGARAHRTIPFGVHSADAARDWLDGSGSAVPGVGVMAAVLAAFVVATVATRGVLGCVVLAGAALTVSASASAVYARSLNVFEASLVAFPVWSLAWIAGMALWLGPLARWGEERVWRLRFDAPPRAARRDLALGAALVALALVLRLLLASPLTALARRVTIP